MYKSSLDEMLVLSQNYLKKLRNITDSLPELEALNGLKACTEQHYQDVEATYEVLKSL